MFWLPLTLLCAFSLATSDALVKKLFPHRDAVAVAWLRLLPGVPLLWALVALQRPPAPGADFYWATALAVPLDTVALVLYIRAIQASPLSMTLPLLAVTPALLLVIPAALLGERLSVAGVAGVLLISLGCYALNIGEARRGFLEPLRALARERGARLMLAVAVIYSLTSTLGKIGVTAASPLLFGAAYFTAMCALVTPFALAGRSRSALAAIRRELGPGRALLPGLVYGAMIVFHMLALSLAPVAYMIAVKRLSLLIGVLYGRFLFGEGRFRERLAGAVLMLAGVLLIGLFP